MEKDTSNFLYYGVKDKELIINFYEKLIQLAPTTYEKEQIEVILADEKNHHQDFKQLSIETSNHESDPIIFRTYRDGLLKAYESELAQYTNYRNALLLELTTEQHNSFFRAMTDDLKHANIFMFLYFRDSL